MEVDLFDAGGGHLGYVHLRSSSDGPSRRTVELAAKDLTQGKCRDLTKKKPAEIDCETRRASLSE